jgi:hypothetical protein
MTRSLFVVLFAAPVVAADRPIDFNRDVRPILSDRCFACHGPDEKHRKAKLRLDTTDGKKVLVPGKPDDSDLIARVTAEDPDDRMPPGKHGKALSPAEVDVLKRWIAEGASWAAHWAYVNPSRVPTPAVADASWPITWPDRFLLARLDKEKLKPSPDADRRTLIRRLSFDLTGLPPSPAEVEAFVNDKHAQAYERLVARLMGGEQYGERMAIMWLDLVRYADTVGYHGDQDHHASPYRDYVIDAFNANLPFDRFTREQLAGDLLPDSGPDQRIATCYNRLLQTSHEGGVQPKEYLAIYAADRVRNVSAVWMGGTVGCAQCHNHKFDPYTAKDFYALAAFFADVDEENHLRGGGGDTVPTKRRPEVPITTRRDRERLAALQAVVANLEKDPAKKKELDAAKKELAAFQKSIRPVMVTQAVTPRTVRVLPRGNWLDETGEIVSPAVPAFLGKLSVGDRRATRLDLANWLTDAKAGAGGLTARVFVNRLWAMFFGSGLSNSLEDFGAQGEPPVHPELLDALAVEFVESGWDVKHMVRLMVTSRAYRQSSAGRTPSDPANRLYARQTRSRLPAEMVRDNALSVSGLLNREVGGASAKPYQPAGYYRHLNFPKREYASHADDRQYRRGLYVHWQRQYLHPMLKAFDAPTREECTAARPKSNTPIAALVLLNDPTFLEAARVFAHRVMTEGGTNDERRLAFAFREVTGRTPDDTERTILAKVLAADRARYKSEPEAANEAIHIGLKPVPASMDVVELAAWTGVGRVLLNLSETITRE